MLQGILGTFLPCVNHLGFQTTSSTTNISPNLYFSCGHPKVEMNLLAWTVGHPRARAVLPVPDPVGCASCWPRAEVCGWCREHVQSSAPLSGDTAVPSGPGEVLKAAAQGRGGGGFSVNPPQSCEGTSGTAPLHTQPCFPTDHPFPEQTGGFYHRVFCLLSCSRVCRNFTSFLAKMPPRSLTNLRNA